MYLLGIKALLSILRFLFFRIYFLIKNIKGTLLLIILPLSIACLMAPYIIPLVLGSEWSKTGFYFLYMFPAYSAILLTSPYVYIPQYYFKQHLINNVESGFYLWQKPAHVQM